MTQNPPHPSLPRLTRGQFWGTFAVLLAIFLFAHGPIWRNAWRPDAFDGAVLWSYGPIPIFVAAGLAYKKRLSWKAFLLDTMELTFLKYSVTFLFAMGLWAITPRPKEEAFDARTHSTLPSATAARAPATMIPDDRRGLLEGLVLDRGGAPIPFALVYVASGLEAFTFDPRKDPLEVVDDGSGFALRGQAGKSAAHVLALQRGQTLEAKSTDGQLHTFVAHQGTASLFNTPVLGSGAPSTIDFRDASGLLEVICSVHAHLGTERPARLRLLAHPFFTRTGEDGRFKLEAVPAGALELVAETDAAKSPPTRVELAAKGRANVELRAGDPL